MNPTEALVYDARCCYVVVAEDFRITPSRDDASAYHGVCGTAHRRQFPGAVLVSAASIRKLTVAAGRSAEKSSK